ncbi:hypothetical protein BOTBODRAFT_37885 [Botryobasidium botryosum FD-172 SS1]|uniref:Uncharacterized protein n=1 Tax=Botryobasidium botryosum (strain FD-172 SS1) TaxID=930990 RepID=A0A067LYX4_BOTB1|nr:hypothetical protein BOTBODRAFT_37885 [Botryobasidium botryosum FD-172 SS1]
MGDQTRNNQDFGSGGVIQFAISSPAAATPTATTNISAMNTSQFASFAQYTPPPDGPPSAPPSKIKSARAWFPSSTEGASGSSSSYQAGGVPTFGNSVGGGADLGIAQEEGAVNQWESTCGWRVDLQAASAYLLGPITALLFLVIEISNDYVRFHAYQSALFSTPLIAIRFLLSFIFPAWFISIITLGLLGGIIFMAVRAYKDANQGGLARYHLPWIGEIAERWVEDE